MPKKRFDYLRVILPRFVVVCAATALVAIVVGCMNICVDRSLSLGLDGVCKQDGTISVAGGQELDVYYPVAFSTPPYLTLTSGCDDCLVIAQNPDHFRIKNTMSSTRNVDWVAKGVRGMPPNPPIPVTTVPTNGLPAEPVPVTGQ